MPLSPKDRRALLWGGPVAALLAIYLLSRGSGAGPPPEPLPADAPAAAMAAPPPVIALPPPAPLAAASVTAAPAADVAQLRLVGILSRGALIAMADGSQRFVPVGREIVPGIVLRGVDVHQAILATPGGEVRLPFDVAGTSLSAPPPSPAPGPRPGLPPIP